ncbi:DNA-processing protein DprA [Proteinivorax hydrogeniformans]|uniref:DNA-processing protein DprA n=1 Tax=Proteinivorax hydrogeniformans TaxID=1826727 RepID=A0AAU8HQW5_9FIRM
MEKKELALFLSHCPRVGSRRSMYIIDGCSSLNDFKNRFDQVFLEAGLGNHQKLKSSVKKYLNNFSVEDTIIKYKQKNVEIISIFDSKYPDILRQLYDFPISLFCKGNTGLLQNDNKISVVGARLASWYGKTVAKDISEQLSRNGFTIVSGMAKGIDACSHQGALSGEGSSIGVLGCGIDKIYPQENKKLYKEMEEKGLLLSTFPIGAKPLSGNFPARNRIISGLSKGIIVVEAAQRSGSLITADFALEQGKDVFSVPGNVNSPLSTGTNNLIKEGAIVATSFKDIINEYTDNKDNNVVDSGKTNGVKLEKVEQEILRLAKGQRISFDQLMEDGNFSSDILLSNLLTLEIKGLIKKDGNQRYIPI